ncbi:MAG: class I SAM-dependent methyltransferase [Thainema sp.]
MTSTSTPTPRYSDYDIYARIYNDEIGNRLSRLALPPLEQLLFPVAPPPATLLDLCCGTGHLAADLTRRGYTVQGLDGSEQMLHYARLNAPAATFILADARSFSLSQPVQAVISTSDSLNHILQLDELSQVFQNVYAALSSQGYFLFDFNLESRYQADTWNGSLAGGIADDYAWAAQRVYDNNLGQVHLTIFQRVENDLWQRSDSCLTGRSYDLSDVQLALTQAGFTDIQIYDAQNDFNIHDWGPGKVYVWCRKQAED